MKILIVDDNQSLATVIQYMLEQKGYEVSSAFGGLEGYSAYFQFQPDLVITDIQMPGENGFELINHIREQDPSVKTIYMSGNLDQFDTLLEEEKKRFPINVLRKPFFMDDLINRVSEFNN
ncbi:MAG: response regulator [Deltaproteobacteria bacterium]|nr:response regulator [Deltaproteobacteria bacterium]